MKLVPNLDNVTLYEEGFEADLLNRKDTSKALSEILERFEDPLVVALDGRWGTGKSFFLKRWVGAHGKENGGSALTLYFDAFENDYLTDPLIALVAAISARLPPEEQPKIDKVKRAAIKMLKPALKVGLAVATAGASVVLNEVGDAAAEAVSGEAQGAVEAFWKKEEGRTEAMREFRSAITQLTTNNDSSGNAISKKLIIVIDELDRCRPDFALELLEIIKHFFAVPKVHFILGVNLSALENSVKVRYGSGIEASAYLQKFLSFRVTLPSQINDHHKTSTVSAYATTIGRKMGFPRDFLDEVSRQITAISKANHISIRDVNKIMTAFALMPDAALDSNTLLGYRITVITLAIARVVNSEAFKKFINVSATYQEILEFYGATEETITQSVDGKQNPKYDAPTHAYIASWAYMHNDKKNLSAEDAGWVSNWFNYFGRPDVASQIPKNIYNDWLNIFRAD